jgi:HK97 family phage prohead protease
MPYGITNNQTDCAGWAMVKEDDYGQYVTVSCHVNKQDAINNMVAVSLAENIDPLGEVRASKNKVLICDIDDTLIHNGRIIPDVADFMSSQDFGIILVTGRLIETRRATEQELAKLGIDYDQLKMNNLGSTAKSVEFKKQTAIELLKVYEVMMAIDNDGGAREAYASLGIPVINPNNLPTKRDLTMDPTQPSPVGLTAPIPTEMLGQDQQTPGVVSNTDPELEGLTITDLYNQLRDLMGDVVIFKFVAHGFHWNVRGINFQQFHELFGEIYQDAEESIDGIGENIRRLNFDAPFRLSEFMESAPELEPTDSTDPLEMCRSLYMANEDVRECLVKALDMADDLEQQGVVNFLAERLDQHSKWQWQLRAIVGDSFARQYEIDVYAVAEGDETGQGNEDVAPADASAGTNQSANAVANNQPVVEMNSSKWANAAKAIVRKLDPIQEVPLPETRSGKLETRVVNAHFEMRGETLAGSGMQFSGYAAMFDSPSEPLPFTETIAPGAFKRSLKTHNDVKLLWNHETGTVLGSTRAGTLQLVEDATGLKAIATLPDTQAGRDAATLIKRGDVANMSFGFTVPKGGDTWSMDGQTRTLNSVRLHEVSIVAFPAYQATSVSVRSNIDTDELAGALEKLETGVDLNENESSLLRDVISKLTKTEVNVSSNLDIKKKNLDLLMNRV